MEHSKPVNTPIPTHPPHTMHRKPLDNPTEYRSLLGSLQYIILTRPDISYTVKNLAQYMQLPMCEHLKLLHWLLRYLNDTLHMGITIHANSPLSLHAYSDAYLTIDKDDYISTTVYIIYLGRNPISWTSWKQKTRARSSTEAEYRVVAATAAKILWLNNLLQKLGQCPTIQNVN